jgi:metal-responsive CopG/Arc/MetJ family transcriptional regulator
MKIKTSLTLSEELIAAIDKKSVDHKSRSDFIENALWTYLKYLIRLENNRADLKIINNNADSLNQEAHDVLNFQVSI